MGNSKMLLKIFRSTFIHHRNRDSRSIGSDQCARGSMLLDLFKNTLFDVKPFDHHLDNPVHISDF